MIEIKVDEKKVKEIENVKIDSAKPIDLANELGITALTMLQYAFLKWGNAESENFKRFFLQIFDCKQKTFYERIAEVDAEGDQMKFIEYLQNRTGYLGHVVDVPKDGD